MFVDYIYVWLN